MMKKKIRELDLDDIGFVGGGRPYTEEDAKAFSAWIHARKKQQTKKKSRLSKGKSNRNAA